MKTKSFGSTKPPRNPHLPCVSVLLLASIAVCHAASTIDYTNSFAYGANVGWLDWRADPTRGAVIGEYVCSGSLYAANLGWINLGNGSPTNGIQYQNLSATDYGVNVDGLGNLRGMAYGANIGWINFEPVGSPKVNPLTGRFSGSAYSANCGWISLSNAVAHVQTISIAPGSDSDGNGLPDAWELTHFGKTGINPNADPDGDRSSNLQEYQAGTNPRDAASDLRITSYSVNFVSGNDYDYLTWTSVPTRQYRIEHRSALAANSPWADLGFLFSPDPGAATSRSFSLGWSSTQRYFRVKAVRPLGP